MTYAIEDLALAYELHAEGCTWKRIAIGLSCDWKILRDRVRNAVAGGVHDPRIKLTQEALQGAHVMRTRSRLSWNAIGAHYGVSGASMRSAYHRRFTA